MMYSTTQHVNRTANENGEILGAINFFYNLAFFYLFSNTVFINTINNARREKLKNISVCRKVGLKGNYSFEKLT